MEVPTWAEFWVFVQTPTGIGLFVVAIVGGLKRLSNEKFPAWVQKLGAFVVGNAMLVSVGVALILSLLVFLIAQYNLDQFLSKYFVIFALAWAASQGGYAIQKAGSLYLGRVRRGEAAAEDPKSG